jgi:hypothetical protein
LLKFVLSEVQSTNFVRVQDADGGRDGGHVVGGGGRHLHHHGGQQRVQLRHAQQVLRHPHGRLHGGEATARQVQLQRYPYSHAEFFEILPPGNVPAEPTSPEPGRFFGRKESYVYLTPLTPPPTPSFQASYPPFLNRQGESRAVLPTRQDSFQIREQRLRHC